jgi:DNA (cytosine-5)-methyltransferase 1
MRENTPTEGSSRGTLVAASANGDRFPVPSPTGVVVDLFCGAGGLTHGFRQEGFHIAAGIDVDEACRYAYEHNNDSPFVRRDVYDIEPDEIKNLFVAGRPAILVGCAPCQPFSTYNQKNTDPKWALLNRFASLISQVGPDIVSMENVPRLLNFRRGETFKAFVQALENDGYTVSWKLVSAPEYGVPQRRTRLVLLASLHGPIAIEPGSRAKDEYPTVADAIGHLPKLAAGQADDTDPLHRSSRLADANKQRIQASIAGGTWRDWSEDLVSPCHRVETGGGYVSVYGRMRWEEPAPTITTQFFGFGNGRFGHPEQDRAISLREGAILQTFPEDYAVVEPGKPIMFRTVGRMIGNAVPVLLGRVVARSIRRHLDNVVA